MKPRIKKQIEEEKISNYVENNSIIEISALKQEGIEKLENKIENLVYKGDVKNSSEIVISNTRHRDALAKAHKSVMEALNAIYQKMPLDFIEVDLKNIWDYLGYINGDTVTEDLLDNIFNNFCIGK